MFHRLLEATPDRREVSDGFIVEFTDQPNRNYVEPALKQQGFEVDDEWLVCALVDLDLPEAPAPAGAHAVEAGPDDALALAEATQAYGGERLSADGIAAAFASGQRIRWLCASDGARVGYARLSVRPGGRTGVVHDLAVAPDRRGTGLGTTLLRAALNELRAMGAIEASARVAVGNTAGIALLRGAGFRQTGAGVTYRRPADEEEVRRRFEAKRGHAVKFGGWR
jgi:ribosomal protein S18 acetylase RimI-like enzyme